MDDCDTWQEHESTGLQCFHFGFKILFQLKILLLQCFILSRSYRQCSVHLKLFFLNIGSKFRHQPKSLFVICVVRSCDWSSWTVGDRCSTLPLPVGCTEKGTFQHRPSVKRVIAAAAAWHSTTCVDKGTETKCVFWDIVFLTLRLAVFSHRAFISLIVWITIALDWWVR